MEAVARVVVARVAGTEEAVRAVVERAVAGWGAVTVAAARAAAIDRRTVDTRV